MKKILSLGFIFSALLVQASLDDLRWYLSPAGVEIKVDIDDLHHEVIRGSEKMNWGYSAVKDQVLKKEITIALIDGGVDIDHPEIKDFIKYNELDCYQGHIIPPMSDGDKDENKYQGDCAGWSFVDNKNRTEDEDGHGTHVSGIITTILRDHSEKIKILPIKVFAANEGKQNIPGLAPLNQRLLKAFEYAIERKVDVIHLSVGWPKSYMTVDLEEMIKRAQKMDIVIVAAAGNSSQRATIYPCQMEGVICVGAMRANGEIARFSNWGSQVDIYAPGEKILSTIPYQVTPLHLSRKGYDYKNGTSQAAPFITASVALLRSVYPEEKADEIYSRLMLGADQLESGQGVRGLFHLEKSLQLNASSYVIPKLKGLHSVLIENNKFEISLIIKNQWLSKNTATTISIRCLDVNFDESKKTIEALEKKAEIEVKFNGTLAKNHDDLNCQIKIDEIATSFTLKAHHPFETSEKKILSSQEKPYMVMTKTGARSRFLTINPIPGRISQAFYYLPGLENLPIYDQGTLLGNISFEKNCQFLRIWQVDLNRDEKIDFMTESLCDKSFLKYQFYGQDLQKLFSDVHYKPALTIINYDNFEMITFRDKAPSFKFINSGLSTPDPSPWANNTVSRKAHLYELQARLVDKEWRYEVSVLEQPKKWMQTLGLRVEPSYQVLHVMQDQLLIMIEKKTALVNLKTQSAQWAGLDHILWMGSQKQPVVGTDEIIFQSFLTQYEYRGFLLNGTKLRFSQNDHFDPLIDILGTLKNANGYLTTLRSFQSLWYVQYNFVGEMISLKKAAVDRFDFLTAQDLISSIINLKHNGEMIQVVDGTKLNTNFIDIIKNGVKKSYRVPERCATQSPVLDEGELKMVLFCAKTVKEFEINFIKL